jgi:methyl-accepting chemotaxis protein
MERSMARMLKKYYTDISKEEGEHLLQNEDRLAVSAKAILNISTSLSNFDVDMRFLAGNLGKAVSIMQSSGESNLAAAEEISASMSQVNEIVSNTAVHFEKLHKNSQELEKKNGETTKLLGHVADLKDEVITATEDMDQKMDQLASLIQEIGDIVKSVQAIANQTNLLALNASIEAARAGEAGKGFAVVAHEIGKLSDDTKKNLENMTKFVTEISTATSAGRESVKHSVASTAQMGENIEAVSQTVGSNIQDLNMVMNEIQNLFRSVEEIRSSAAEVDKAMETVASDQSKMLETARSIAEDAKGTIKMATSLSSIDDKLSESNKQMFAGLLKGRHAITNDELLGVVQKAKQAHQGWLQKVTKIVCDKQTQSLQTNPDKCAFGHCYKAIQVNHPLLKKEWDSIGPMHRSFHTMGDKILHAVESGNDKVAMESLREAEGISEKLMKILGDLEDKIKKSQQNKVKIFE